jgi:hypothetical protein
MFPRRQWEIDAQITIIIGSRARAGATTIGWAGCCAPTQNNMNIVIMLFQNNNAILGGFIYIFYYYYSFCFCTLTFESVYIYWKWNIKLIAKNRTKQKIAIKSRIISLKYCRRGLHRTRGSSTSTRGRPCSPKG